MRFVIVLVFIYILQDFKTHFLRSSTHAKFIDESFLQKTKDAEELFKVQTEERRRKREQMEKEEREFQSPTQQNKPKKVPLTREDAAAILELDLDTITQDQIKDNLFRLKRMTDESKGGSAFLTKMLDNSAKLLKDLINKKEIGPDAIKYLIRFYYLSLTISRVEETPSTTTEEQNPPSEETTKTPNEQNK